MDWLYSLLDNSSVPVVTALILGILTAVSPCPLATNLTAVAYLGREIDNRRKAFYFGSLYTLGRAVTYSALGAVLIFLIRKGEDAFGIQNAISTIGEWVLGPALVLIGLFILFGHLLHLPKFGKLVGIYRVLESAHIICILLNEYFSRCKNTKNKRYFKEIEKKYIEGMLSIVQNKNLS